MYCSQGCAWFFELSSIGELCSPLYFQKAIHAPNRMVCSDPGRPVRTPPSCDTSVMEIEPAPYVFVPVTTFAYFDNQKPPLDPILHRIEQSDCTPWAVAENQNNHTDTGVEHRHQQRHQTQVSWPCIWVSDAIPSRIISESFR